MAIEVTLNIGAAELELEVTPGLRDVYLEGGSGDVLGPASSVNNNLPKFGDSTGKRIADSGVSTTDVQSAISHISATVGAHGMSALGASVVAAADASSVRTLIELGSTDSPSFDEVTVDTVNFDITADEASLNEGEITWDSDEHTLRLGLSSGNHVHLGQEIIYFVENATASAISKGTLVCFAGTVGASGKLRVSPWTGAQPYHTIMGIVSGDITAGIGEVGYVVHFGKVRGFNTTGSLYSESWVAGDVLYAKPTGGLTKTRPDAPATIIAAVTNVHATNGTVHVRLTEGMTASDVGAVALNANADTLGSGAATDGYVLTSDGAGGSAWEAVPGGGAGPIDLTSDVTGTLPVANGGTGQTSLSSVDAAELGSGAATDGYVLTSDGAGGSAWEAVPGGGGSNSLYSERAYFASGNSLETNTLAFMTARVNMTISRIDAEVQGGNAPTIQLYRDGVAVGSSLVIDGDGYGDQLYKSASVDISVSAGQSLTVVVQDTGEYMGSGAATGPLMVGLEWSHG